MTRGRNAAFLPTVIPTPASNRGWEDYLAGRGFPPEYDTWNQVVQRHYERGRLRAAGARLAGYRSIPAKEPRNIIARTNGLRLVPPDCRKDR